MSSRWFSGLLGLVAMPLAAALDPTLPPGPAQSLSAPPVAGAPLAGLQLQAILRGPQASSVVIDGLRLQAGERRAGIHVLQIQPRSVLVEYRGRRQRLTLTPEFIVPRP